MNDTVRKIHEYLSKEQENLVRFLSDLIEIESLTGSEEAVVARVKEEMEKCLFDEVIVDSIGNVVGRIGSGPRTMVFDAHLDTVGGAAGGMGYRSI